MDGTRLPGVASLEVHRTLPSTNERARAWVAEGVEPVAVVVATEQTRGRGRGGSRWVSRAGSGLWMSVIVWGVDPERDALLPLRTGLALAARLDAMPERAGEDPIRLKWPNDLFVREGKAGGILCESIGDRVVVGVGLNCAVPAVDSPYPVGALEGLEPATLLPLAVAAVLEADGRREPFMQDSEITAWRARDLLAGTEVETSGGVRGQAQGIDPRGRLSVAGPGGAVRSVNSGSVRSLESSSF